MRDFRDVYNSWTKFVSARADHVDRMGLLKDYSSYQKFNYLNPDDFYMFLSTWKQYTEEYIGHKDGMHLIKYEDLMDKPSETLKELAHYLDVNVNDEAVDGIIKDLFNKELHTKSTAGGGTGIRHFSGSDKRAGEWREFFCDRMVDAVKKEIGGYLVEFGYELDGGWGVSDAFSADADGFRKKIENAFEAYDEKNFLKKLNAMLKNKKAAVFGAGEYSGKMISLLDNKHNIVMIADDNADKHGTKLCGIEISATEELVRRFMDYDFILLGAGKQHEERMLKRLTDLHISKHLVESGYSTQIDYMLPSE